MKNDIYGIYCGREYRIAKLRDKKLYCISDNEESLTDGFYKYRSNSDKLVKEIQPDELDEIYELTSYALYQGVKFLILSEGKDTYDLAGGEEEARKFPEMICHNKGEFSMKINKEDVDLIVEKRPVSKGYFK